MPKFTVECRKDAFIDYVAEVQADSAAYAAELAAENPADFKRTPYGEQEFEATVYVTLDRDGHEIAETERATSRSTDRS